MGKDFRLYLLKQHLLISRVVGFAFPSAGMWGGGIKKYRDPGKSAVTARHPDTGEAQEGGGAHPAGRS
ncbi:hypothetical protein MBOURGENBZM_20370 [Methanoculleus bourgensis]|nr:hypothetical protein MBOURGENBZM_20370 [Methanoculleus bourgensis]